MKTERTVFDVLSKISNISTKEIKEIAKKVVQNNKILNACSKHQFDIKIEGRKWECTNCGGIVDITKKNWYEKGIKHGSKRGNKI